ncbi:unnamed protein product [Lactuca virosa]|uniref:Uncharacterized protein n=1 Tax=Lactuca virosa TaxID=75947 RepID=A0AAU9ME36_9ASTR|nr:unnamed protein product [Lactuca virosa]
MNKRAEQEGKSKEKMIKMLSSAEPREYMQNTLVGEVKNFQALMNVKAFQEVEGFLVIFMRYLGGLKMLLEFSNECIKNSPNLAFERVGIVITYRGLINTGILILVDGMPYLINVMEDLFESLKISPVLAANDYYPNMAWLNEGDVGNNNNNNSESAIQSEDDFTSLETSPANNHQSQHREDQS